MSARTANHRTTRAPFPERTRRWSRAGVLPLLVVVALTPAAAFAQEDLPPAQRMRARDLSVLEDLLSGTIQDSINATVQAINAENAEVQEIAREENKKVELRYVFRTSGQTEARGMFLQDYGVIFTVQVPNVTFTPSTLIIGATDTTWRLMTPDAIRGGALAQEYQMRYQLNRLHSEIGQLTEAFTGESVASGQVSDYARELQAAMVQFEQAYAAGAAEREAAAARQRASEQGDRRLQAGAGVPFTPGDRGVTYDATEMAHATEVANGQKSQIEGKVIETVIDTLARYGSVIHGLRDEDRLAVVLLPSSYLNQIGSWARATKRAEEFIISVSYSDINALDDGSMDLAEFSRRIRVEMRLGQPFITHGK